MTEDYKTMRCCGPNGCGTVVPPGEELSDSVITNLSKIINAPRWCIGTKCMAWQSLRETIVTGYNATPLPDDEWEKVGAVDEGYKTLWIKKSDFTDKGYCGHAGKP